ncbi:PREDICTED: non-specific lipid-transfer protein 3 [Tarenaya hassleriana]|uniref:non-specific lipid-transfer protein 3 n=1 Tax=Tarenaya hassleriana TaxID=28532 RepID=UPI00053C606F|nr:PREDICTED: non-specific lipid-transfer protein 3 [Tarenaya hassleriana]
MKNSRVLVVVALVWVIASWAVEGAGECGRTPIGSVDSLAASKTPRAKVPPSCCAKVTALIRTNPRCLCAVMLSPLAARAGINPAIAIGIPKRCSIRNRPAGKRCGRYVVP